MDIPPKIEDFYGVYLLCSQSEEKKYRNKCYIGYTVNPNRRINQHNKGKDFGGAKKTNQKGPWKMIMIIHGFPNNISALQFEWAWQSPKLSSRLKILSNINKKKCNESYFDYNFRILAEMLRIGPWNRLPLIIRWLASDYVKEFPADKLPPMHMQICHGHVSIKKKPKLLAIEQELMASQRQTVSLPRARIMECHLCMKMIANPQRTKIMCINPKCKLTCHIICLANQCLERGQYVPIEGDCPICETHFLWGDLIRKKNGCSDLEEGEDHGHNTDDENNFDGDNGAGCTDTDEDSDIMIESEADDGTESDDN